MKVWGVRLAFLGSTLALIATSGPPQYSDRFVLEQSGSSVTLSREVPRASVLIRARALALSHKGQTTTSGAGATVSGTIQTSGGSAFIAVTLSEPAKSQATSGLNAVTSFNTGHALTFDGDCVSFDAASPCQAELELRFERDPGAATEAVSRIDWSVSFSNHVRKDKDDGNDGPFGLPWEVEIEQR